MSRTEELSLVPSTSQPLLVPDDFPIQIQPTIYTVTLSINFGFMAGLADTAVGAAVLRVISIIVAMGGFVASLAVIVLAPLFPSLLSTVPPQASSPHSEPLAASSPHTRQSRVLRRRHSPAIITLSVRRDPTILPIIERSERDSKAAPPARRVSFSPTSSNASVPTPIDPPSRPGSSNGHGSVMNNVLEIADEPAAYILPTPPASIASVSSEGDDTETMGVDEFGNASPGVGKRGRKPFSFARKPKGKEEAVRADTREELASGLFKNRRRTQSLGYAVEATAELILTSGSRKRNSLLSHCSRESSIADDTLRESDADTDRASRTSAVEKEARRRSGLSFQDFKVTFGKRERRTSAQAPTPTPTSATYALPSPSLIPQRAELEAVSPSPNTPRSPGAGSSIGLGRPSTGNATRVSPRSASDESPRTKLGLRLDTAVAIADSERREVQSPLVGPGRPESPSKRRVSPPLFGGEVVIRNESGRRRTRSSAIQGLYADAEVIRRW